MDTKKRPEGRLEYNCFQRCLEAAGGGYRSDIKRLVSFGFFLNFRVVLILANIINLQLACFFFGGFGSVNSLLICSEFFIKFH